jgi:peptide/nickel transport system substrate-binding protein
VYKPDTLPKPYRLLLSILLLGSACTPTLTPTATPAVAPTPTVSPTPGVVSAPELTICITDEPQSLYLYAPPEAGRDDILAALYDGPIDNHDYTYQPVILKKLPSVADGDAAIENVVVISGDLVVDALGRVITLTEGIELPQIDGTNIVYRGSSPVAVPQMSATFELKPDISWSDGAPLTADDSLFSFEISQSPDSFTPRRDLIERTDSYHVLDSVRVTWTGLPGYIDPLYFTNFWTPLPRHWYGALALEHIGDSPEVNQHPLGWGPFVLQDWVSGDHLTFERNPHYFRAAEGLPYFERVTYRIIPDPAAILADLQAEKCDLTPYSPKLDTIADALSNADAVGKLRLQRVSGTTLEHLDFGITPAESYARAVGNDFFQDVRVRQAFAHCLDRDALIPGYYPAEILDAYLPVAHPLHGPARDNPYPFDSAQGRALFANAGWTDSDGDGTLDKSGVALRLTLASGPVGDPIRERLLQAIQTQLRDNCGIEIETRPLTRGELEGNWPDGLVFGRQFDLAEFGWEVGSLPPCELFTSAQIPSESNPAGANDTGYSNSVFDLACRQALTTFDPQISAQLHTQAQRLFAQDLPILPLFLRAKLAAARPGVSGFVLDPTSSGLWNIESLILNP